MIKTVRHNFILNRIKVDHRIYISSLSEELEISDDTLRRDFIELDKQGLLTKVHGGAIAKSEIPIEFNRRFNTGIPAKQQLAKKTIPLFKSGDTILIDGGTSNLELARQLPFDMNFTIYTNSFPIINELIDRTNIEFIFLGGDVFPSSRTTIGVPVIQSLWNIRPDWLVLGASNIHPQLGITDVSRNEATVKRAMVESGKQSIVLCDTYKLNSAESYTVASLRDIDYLVLEDDKVETIKKHWMDYPNTIL